MATKAEQFRSEEMRQGERTKRRQPQKKPKKSEWSRKSKHAGAKATRALEKTEPGHRPSRESTRSSANRAKGDTALNLTEEKRKGSPESRARRSVAKRARVRGGASSR
ncbi:MAG TPA: hypothetical protein VEK07_06700 [Polyangiaceae bacterium]|nr:hypothetical protein [Polyangiaceae bacterium]